MIRLVGKFGFEAVRRVYLVERAGSHPQWRSLGEFHCSLAYSALACFRMGTVGVGVFQCGIWSLCAKNLLWHSFAADSNPLNSGVPRNFPSSGSVCKAV